MADLTKAEAQVYDRQLRVWGVEVQKRLQDVKILLVGCGGLAAEVAKNIVLAGVGSVVLADDTPCRDAPPGNFLIHTSSNPNESVASVSAATLQEMNPLVKVTSQPMGALSTAQGFQPFNLVVCLGQSIADQLKINKWCRAFDIMFYSGRVLGGLGHFFVDLQKHTYNQKGKANKAGPSCSSIDYVPLEEALRVPTLRKKMHGLFFVLQVCADFESRHNRQPGPGDMDEMLSTAGRLSGGQPWNGTSLDERTLCQYVCGVGELPPVSAVIGGVLANEIVKAIGGNSEPLRNFFFYSILDGKGVAECVGV
ncbi:hypothetical protein BSKO_06332 [Bryopsis sp. KO-2023]|nr:hypothetical protein BSKO_06332 [Bryopsis sp. KO-2023]